MNSFGYIYRDIYLRILSLDVWVSGLMLPMHLLKFYVMIFYNYSPLQNGRWGVSGIEEGETGDRLVTYTCPQHFCQCLRVTNTSLELTCSFLFNPKWPNEQCICGRQGIVLSI